MRLIDADSLKLNAWPERYTGEGIVYVEDIDNAPTVEAVEVKHGRWEKASETMPIYRCSVCKERNLFKNGDNVLSNYCPNCGADMRGDGNG